MYKVISFQIADSIDIKTCKANFEAKLIYGDADELFYETSSGHYIYIFKYGVVSFLNYKSDEIPSILQTIYPVCKNRFQESISDEFDVETIRLARCVVHLFIF